MNTADKQQSSRLIEHPRYRRRQIVAFIVIFIIIAGLVISFFTQPYGTVDAQQDNVLNGFGWTAQILVSFIALLAAIVQLTGYTIRDLFNSRATKTNVEEFPFHIIQEYDSLLDYLFPDPKTPLISDRKIKYLPQIAAETDAALQTKGMVLICGRSKTGKTREMCELLRRWWYSGPTVLVARSHVGLYPPFKIPENLPVRNLVLIFDDIDRYIGSPADLKNLDDTIRFFQNICHNRGELHVIATVRQEDEFWEKLSFDQKQVPWNKFELIQLNPLSSEKAEDVITELSQMSEITIEPSFVRTLAEKNDGTFLNLALAFRGWLSQNINAVTLKDIHAFDGALKTTWRKRYEELADSHSDVKPVYAAIYFLQSHNLPLRPSLITELATEMWLNKWVLASLGVFDRFQNWFEMSPIFNWNRNPQLRRKGWLSIFLIAVLVIYLLSYVFLRFMPIDTQLWFFVVINIVVLCFVFLLIPFLVYLVVYRELVFRRINKALNLMLATEVPLRGNELYPYENQFDRYGSTRNWELENYSGRIHEQSFVKRASQRLMNRYILLSDQFRLNGEFSAARKLATLAQELSLTHPAPVFMLGKLDIDEENYGNAIDLLNKGRVFYGRSNNSAHVLESLALSYLFLGDYSSAEQFANSALGELSDLTTARWILGLAQLKLGKNAQGNENCEKAARQQPVPVEIKKAMESIAIENKFSTVSIPGSTSKQLQNMVDRAIAFLMPLAIVSVIVSVVAGYIGVLTKKVDPVIPSVNILLAIFPDSPLFLISRGSAYYDLGEYEKSLKDYSEAIQLDPNYASSYNGRGNAYLGLGDGQRAVVDYNEAIRIGSSEHIAIYYNNRGFAYYALKEYEKALSDFDQAIYLDPEVPEAHNGRGNVYYDQAEYKKAIEEYSKAIQLGAEETLSLCYSNRGSAYMRLGEHEKAIEDFTEAILVDPRSAKAYNSRGNAYYSLGEYENAILDYTDAIRVDPEYAYAYGNRGSTYNQLGEYEKSLSDYTTYIQLNPSFANQCHNAVCYTAAINLGQLSVEAYLGRGDIYFSNGENEKALSDYTEAINIDPKSAIAYRKHGDVLYELDKKEEALEDYTESIRLDPSSANWCNNVECHTAAIGLDPNNVNAYSGRGSWYYYIGEYDKALLDYSAIIRIAENAAFAYKKRGDIYYQLEKIDMARAEYKEAFGLDLSVADTCSNVDCYTVAIEFDPNDSSSYVGRGWVYFSSGEYEKALADYSEAIRLDTQYAYAYKNRGDAYYQLRQYDKALVDYDKSFLLDPSMAGGCGNVQCYTAAINRNPESADFMIERGNLYVQQKEYDKSLGDFNEAIRIDPQDAYAYKSRGDAYYQFGEYEKAMLDYIQAININPRYANAYKGRGMLYQAMGMQAEANADFEKYKELTARP